MDFLLSLLYKKEKKTEKKTKPKDDQTRKLQPVLL
jgi:hypothetical protein